MADTQQISDTAIAIAKAIDASPIANDTIHNLVIAATDAAILSTARDPITATTTAIKVYTDLLRLGPDFLDAWHKTTSWLWGKKEPEPVPSLKTSDASSPAQS